MSWDRILWGVEFSDGRTISAPILTPWRHTPPSQYPGEPPRLLFFCTRDQVRAWCKDANKEHEGTWKFRPVRLRETVIRERA